MKTTLTTIAVLAITATSALAGDFGSTPSMTSGYDRVRTSSGAECQTSLDTGKYFSVNTFAKQDHAGNDSFGVQAGFTFMLGRDKIRRVNCNSMYDLQVSRDQLEIQRLRAEIELLNAQKAAIQAGTNTQPVSTGDDW